MRSMVLAASLLMFTAVSPAAETSVVQPLAPEDAFELNEFAPYGGATAISPDNKRVAYTACDTKRASEQRSGVLGGGVMATPDAPPYTLGCDVWISATEGGAARNITGGQGNSWAPAWSPDGRLLMFLSDRDGKPQLFVWQAASSSIRKVIDAPVRGMSGVSQWLPDSDGILVRLRPQGRSDAELGIEAPKQADGSPQTAPDDPPIVTVQYSASARRMAEASNPKGAAEFTSPATTSAQKDEAPKNSISDIAIVSASTGEIRTLVKSASTRAVTLSPDGKSLYYLQWKPGRPFGAFIDRYDLIVVALASGKQRVIASDLNMRSASAIAWSPDSHSIAYYSTVAQAQGEGLQKGFVGVPRADLFVVAVAGGKQRRCIPPREMPGFTSFGNAPVWREDSSAVFSIAENALWSFDVEAGRCREVARDPKLQIRSVVASARGAAWAPQDSVAVVLAQNVQAQEDGFYSIDSAGRLHARLSDVARYDAPVASADGRRLFFKSERASEPQDLWATTAAFAAPTRITQLNPQLAKYQFGRSRLIEFRSGNGESLQASVLLPSDYRPGRRYPTVLIVYASGEGASSVNSFGLSRLGGQFNFQLLATRGYLVLTPDMPVKVGMPMLDSLKTAMPAIDAAVHLGLADPERLAVMGQSNGGFTTLALLVQTQRFKAAVMNAGFGDLAGLFGMTDGVWHPWLLQQGGAMGVPPWEDPLRYVQNSPFYYLDRVTTPLIIQAGGEDRFIHPLSEQVFTGLKYLDKEVTYLRYENDGHVLMRSASRIDYWNRVLPFFERHVKAVAPHGE